MLKKNLILLISLVSIFCLVLVTASISYFSQTNVQFSSTGNIISFVDINEIVSLWIPLNSYGHYFFRNSSNVKDYLSQNNGTIVGGVIINQTYAKLGDGGANFNGSQSVNAPTININTSFGITFSTWIYPTDYNLTLADAYAVSIKNTSLVTGGFNYIGLGLRGNQFKMRIQVNATGCDLSALSTPFSLNTWYHIVGVWNGSRVMIYRNGVLNATTTTMPDFCLANYVGYYNYLLRVGSILSSPTVNSQFINGSMDEPMIFNRSLSATEISDLYTNQSTGKKAFQNDANLVAYYDFDESTHVKDIKEQNHGTAIGGVLFDSAYAKLGDGGANFNGLGVYYINASGQNMTTNLKGEKTISIWFNMSSYDQPLCVGSDRRCPLLVLKNKSGSLHEFRIYTLNSTSSSAGKVSFVFLNNSLGTSGSGAIISSSQFSLSLWNNLIIKINTTGSELYLNGNFNGSASLSSAYGSVTSLLVNPILYIGTDGTSILNSSIDEVMIFNRTLSSTEISDLYTNQSTGKKAFQNDANLVAYYDFDQIDLSTRYLNQTTDYNYTHGNDFLNISWASNIYAFSWFNITFSHGCPDGQYMSDVGVCVPSVSQGGSPSPAINASVITAPVSESYDFFEQAYKLFKAYPWQIISFIVLVMILNTYRKKRK